jgi:hypothetical protein
VEAELTNLSIRHAFYRRLRMRWPPGRGRCRRTAAGELEARPALFGTFVYSGLSFRAFSSLSPRASSRPLTSPRAASVTVAVSLPRSRSVRRASTAEPSLWRPRSRTSTTTSRGRWSRPTSAARLTSSGRCESEAAPFLTLSPPSPSALLVYSRTRSQTRLSPRSAARAVLSSPRLRR